MYSAFISFSILTQSFAGWRQRNNCFQTVKGLKQELNTPINLTMCGTAEFKYLKMLPQKHFGLKCLIGNVAQLK